MEEAVNEALKLIAKAIEIALTFDDQELVFLLKEALDTLAECSI